MRGWSRQQQLLLRILLPVVLTAPALTSSAPAQEQDASKPVYPVWGLAFSPDGTWFAAGAGWARERGDPGWPSNGGPLVVWSAKDWSLAHVHHEPDAPGTLQFTPDGQRLIYRTGGAEVVVLAVPSFEEQRRWPAHEQRVRGLALTPDGRMVATGSREGRTSWWDVETATRRRVLHPPADQNAELWAESQSEISALAISPDGRFLASATNAGALRLWDLASGQVVRKLPTVGMFVSGLRFSNDGDLLLATTYETAMRVYDADSGTLLAKFRGGGHGGDFSPDGRWVVAAGRNAEVIVHRCPDKRATAAIREAAGTAIARFEDDDVHAREEAASAIRRIGLHSVPLLVEALASPHAETRMRARRLLQEVRSPEPEFRLQGHPRTVEEACFSPDGTLLATGCRGGVIKIWQVGAFTEVTTLRVTEDHGVH
jgi:WD40 repeat protein